METRSTNIMRAVARVGTWITVPLGSGASCLCARPSLSRNDTWNWLRADIDNHLPYRAGRHDPAVRGHPARPAVKDRLKQRTVAAAVAPAAVHETGPHPSRRAAAVAAVAVHRAEDLRAVSHVGGVGFQRIDDFAGRGLAATRRDMVRVANRWGETLFPIAGREQRQDHARRTTHDVRSHRPKIQTMPPWLVCRARSGAKSAGGRTSAGSSDRTSPERRNQSPPMPA